MTHFFKIKTTLFVAMMALFFVMMSCDKVKEPYMNNVNEADTTACPVPDFDTTLTPYRVVLLEEFTGHKCPNCPSGAAIAHGLLQLHNEKLVVVAVHAGFFASPDPSGTFTADFTIVAGEEIATHFGVVLNPNGLINRKPYNSNMILSPGNWSSAVNDLLLIQPDAFIQIMTENSATDTDKCIHVRTTFLNSLSGTFNLVVQITENGIVSPQKTNDPLYPSGYISDFEHSHVLRKAVNGTWGTEIATGNVEAGTTITKSYKITPESAWQLANCKVVAYIFNTNTEEVIQAGQAGL